MGAGTQAAAHVRPRGNTVKISPELFAQICAAFRLYWEKVEDPYALPKARLLAFIAFRDGYLAAKGIR